MTFTMIEQYLGGVQMAKFEFLNISRLYSVLILNRKPEHQTSTINRNYKAYKQ